MIEEVHVTTVWRILFVDFFSRFSLTELHQIASILHYEVTFTEWLHGLYASALTIIVYYLKYRNSQNVESVIIILPERKQGFWTEVKFLNSNKFKKILLPHGVIMVQRSSVSLFEFSE